MKKCQKPCHACPFINEKKTIKKDKYIWKINTNVNCETRNVIYMIECNLDKCKKRYIGETDRKLKERITEHKGYINNKILSQPTGQHFNLPGHSISNMKIAIIEKVKKPDTFYRKEREKYHIRKFNTFYEGMNKKM